MSKPQLHTRHSPVPYKSYVIGFVLSIITTLMAYVIVLNDIFTADARLYAIIAIAVVQLVVQMVFFLHIGRGSRWKLLTFTFTLLFVGILVVGSLWVMHNLNYNMMEMSTEEMTEYMHENQGF